MYDSVLKHLVSLSAMTNEPQLSREASLRYSYLKLNVEGKTAPLRRLLDSFTRSKQDSSQWVTSMLDLLGYYQKKKQVDSVEVFYHRIFDYTGERDPDLLNNFAWELVNFTGKYDTALALVSDAVKARPNESNFYDTRALIDTKLHHWPEAVSDATKALNLAAEEDKPFFQKQLDEYLRQMNEEMQKPQGTTTTPPVRPEPAPQIRHKRAPK
jgi:Tfp pilus assembly protein PilF